MAGDFPVPADKLKKLIKQSLRMPIPFGFNPGLSDDNDEYLAAHPRKPPELMGKIALNEGAGSKSAFGTFAFAESEIHLTCFRVVPQLAKRFKKFLKTNKITLNVVVMDENGAILESDIEELAEAFDVGSEDDDLAEESPGATVAAPQPVETQPAAPAAASGASRPARPRSIDPAVAAAAALSDRLKRLQPAVLAAPAPVAQKLGTIFKSAVAQVREGKLKEAGAAISSLETTFAKIGRPPEGAASPAAAAAPAGRDARLPKLRDALIKLEDRAERLLGDSADVILDELEPLAAQIDLGEADAVLAALRKAQEQIAAAAAARAKWTSVHKRLAPKVEAALAGDAPGSLRMRWKFVCGLAEVGDWTRALASVPGLVSLLRESAAGPAPDPVQLQDLWKAALDAADGPDRTTLAAVGAQLEGVFEALRDATNPAERRALQERARALVTEARAAVAA